ncbi:hypothetical protein [Enterococcus sp. 5H]|uniref:hypothetical protein n=1 Tax=Enterococcus sp. 5H TaxID=1229490 RepID=UPI0023030F56|nr:hypothetical protein [Enterococcus sp. 5H]
MVSLGLVGMCTKGEKAEAASLDDMKATIKEGEGLVYNSVSKGIMTEEGSIEFVEVIEDSLDESDTNVITEDIIDQAFEDTKFEKTLVPEEEVPPLITPRVASKPGPNSYKNLDGLQSPYPSGLFTGSGWQYSGYRFKFNNYGANPLFGLKAEKDSFYFHTFLLWGDNARESIVVPANGQWIFTKSSSAQGYGPLYGYFATYNPVKNARYYIY